MCLFPSLCSMLLVLLCVVCGTGQLSLPSTTDLTSPRPSMPISVDSALESMFNLTYRSRMLYEMRTRIHLHHDKVSHSCTTVLHTMLTASTKHRWSHSMLDANAPIPASLMQDQMVSVGGYSQCLAIHDRHNEVVVRGQYCLLDFRVNQQLRLSTAPDRGMDNLLSRIQYVNQRFPFLLGLCVPSTCSAEEINYFIKDYLTTKIPASMFHTKVINCQTSKDYPGSEKSFFEFLKERNLVIASSILGTTISIVLVGTLLDYFGPHSKPSSRLNFVSILTCFSLVRSNAILFGFKSQKENAGPNKPENIESRFSYLHGIRTLFILWILIAHASALIPASIVMPVSILSRHPHDVLLMTQSHGFLGNLFSNGTLAVEGFFLISGLLLVAMIISKNLQNKVNFGQYVFLRWIRFAPSLLGMIAVQKCMVLLGKGPFFTKTFLDASIQKSCVDSEWWKSFLFINNWFSLSDTCLPISWFISVDMQIHMIGFGLIVLLRKRLTSAMLIYCMTMILVSVGLPSYLLATGLPTFSNMDLFARLKQYSLQSYILFYTGTHMHLGSYFYGAIVGYVLVRCKPLFAGEFVQTIVWWVSLAVVFIGPFIPTPEADQVGHLIKGLSVGFQHGFWVLNLGVAFYLLTQADPIPAVQPMKNFLSWSLFKPLSRLSFSMYLSHMTPIWFNVYSSMAPFDVNTNSVTMFTIGVLGETIAISYLIFVLFECPSVNVMKALFQVDKLTHPQDENQQPRSVFPEEDRLRRKAMLLLMHNNGVRTEPIEPSPNTYMAMNVPKIVIVDSDEENNNNSDHNTSETNSTTGL